MTGADHPDRSVTIEGYDRLAADRESLEDWESPWADSPYQEHYVWPAVEGILPDVADARVLDAGCGIGSYVGRFLERGAGVVGVDASEEAIAIARERHGDRATFHRRDLTEPLAFAEDDAFDLVFCNLVLDHVADWEPVLEEFHRVLAPPGDLVFTTIHPMRRFRRHEDELASYYDTEAIVGTWGTTDAEIASYHRPIGEIVDTVATAGFRLEAFREATPAETFAEFDRERYERAQEQPDTLCVRARARRRD